MPIKVRTAIIALLTAVLLVPAASVAEGKKARGKQAAAPAQECVDADLEPRAENVARIRVAILCLHNQIRAERDLPLLRENKRLRRAAVGHSRRMVADKFFDHTTPKGVTMVDRILRARYVRDDEGWSLGENLAWGTGSFGTPRGTVQAWMDSPGHRANILKRAYRELGIGVVSGVPSDRGAGATYTANFGVVRR